MAISQDYIRMKNTGELFTVYDATICAALSACSVKLFSYVYLYLSFYCEHHSFPDQSFVFGRMEPSAYILLMCLWQAVSAAKCCWFIRLWLFCSSSTRSCFFANDRFVIFLLALLNYDILHIFCNLRQLVSVSDISLIYHVIRGQGTIKLYVVYNVLEVREVFIWNVCTQYTFWQTDLTFPPFFLDLWQALSIIWRGCVASFVQLGWGTVNMFNW